MLSSEKTTRRWRRWRKWPCADRWWVLTRKITERREDCDTTQIIDPIYPLEFRVYSYVRVRQKGWCHVALIIRMTTYRLEATRAARFFPSLFSMRRFHGSNFGEARSWTSPTHQPWHHRNPPRCDDGFAHKPTTPVIFRWKRNLRTKSFFRKANNQQ